MNAIILDAGAPADCHPITCTRSLANCPVANIPLLRKQESRLRAAGFHTTAPPRNAAGLRLYVNGDAWLGDDTLRKLADAKGEVKVVDATSAVLAWIGASPVPPLKARRLKAPDDSFRIRYPWDLLWVNEFLIEALAEPCIEGELSLAAHVDGILVLGKGSRVLSGVTISGNVVIGENCLIGPNSFLRGATSIGDNCHVGQAVEIKNSIVMSGSKIPHLSYCGDSIIGANVNLAAGTITANYRHDGKAHRSMVNGKLVDTGRRKLGAVIGDNVHTGIHTSIYPGRKIWPGLSTRPGEIVQSDLKTASPSC